MPCYKLSHNVSHVGSPVMCPAWGAVRGWMLMQVELMRVDVETLSELSAGQTVCDVWHQSSKPKNVGVAQVARSHIFLLSLLCFACTVGLLVCCQVYSQVGDE